LTEAEEPVVSVFVGEEKMQVAVLHPEIVYVLKSEEEQLVLSVT